MYNTSIPYNYKHWSTKNFRYPVSNFRLNVNFNIILTFTG